MKRILTFIAAFCFAASSGFALGGVDLGLFGGVSVPNDKINYVVDVAKSDPTAGELLFASASSGFHIGAKVRLGLADKIDFTGSLAWHKFPEVTHLIPGATEGANKISTSSNIIPVTVGINYTFASLWVVKFYGAGDLSYNYFSNSIDIPKFYESVFTSKKDGGRVGAGFGLGIDIDAKVFKAEILTKYNFGNLIGKEDGEESRNYLSCSLGIFI